MRSIGTLPAVPRRWPSNHSRDGGVLSVRSWAAKPQPTAVPILFSNLCCSVGKCGVAVSIPAAVAACSTPFSSTSTGEGDRDRGPGLASLTARLWRSCVGCACWSVCISSDVAWKRELLSCGTPEGAFTDPGYCALPRGPCLVEFLEDSWLTYWLLV